MSLDVRPADVADVPILLALIQELGAFERASVTATEADLARDGFGDEPRYSALVARLGGEPAGFALYALTYSAYRSAPVLFLEALYVRPARRSRGVGRALMRTLAREAISRGCARFAWEVLDGNRRAIDFYDALGAEPRARQRMMWLDGARLRALARVRRSPAQR